MENEDQIKLIKEQLDEMVGQKYVYGNHHHVIKSYSINEERERVSVQTNKRHFDRPFESAMEFLNKFEKLEERSLTINGEKSAVPLPQPQINADVIYNLKNELMENIKKVKSDKGYIPQAAAVKQNVDSIIDLAKIEVAYIEAFVRMNKIKD